MAAISFDRANEARAALQAIVSDPAHGPDALDDSQTTANLLQDLLPDAPRETGLLIAASVAGLPAILRSHVAQGMDIATAISLAAATLTGRTAFPPEACEWVATELAIALGLAAPGQRPVSEPQPLRPGPTYRTLTRPPDDHDPLQPARDRLSSASTKRLQVAGAESAPPRPGMSAAPGGRGARWRIALTVAAAALAAAAAVALVVAARPGHSPAIANNGGCHRPRATPAGTWSAYHDVSGFSVSLPAGWAVSSRSPHEVKFAVTPAGFVVVVAWSYRPALDALADWRQQAAAKAASDPTYQQIRVRRVIYRGYNAADWEFTNTYQGVLTHVIDRTFIVEPGHLGYAIELYGPDAQWPPVFARLWPRLLASFQPGS